MDQIRLYFSGLWMMALGLLMAAGVFAWGVWKESRNKKTSQKLLYEMFPLTCGFFGIKDEKDKKDKARVQVKGSARAKGGSLARAEQAEA